MVLIIHNIVGILRPLRCPSFQRKQHICKWYSLQCNGHITHCREPSIISSNMAYGAVTQADATLDADYEVIGSPAAHQADATPDADYEVISSAPPPPANTSDL